MHTLSEYQQWQSYTKAGNECFNSSKIKSAKSHYYVALSLSNNLLSAQQTQCDSAYSLLKQAQQRREKQLSYNHKHNDLSALLWGLSKNRSELMVFVKTHSFTPISFAPQSLN